MHFLSFLYIACNQWNKMSFLQTMCIQYAGLHNAQIHNRVQHKWWTFIHPTWAVSYLVVFSSKSSLFLSFQVNHINSRSSLKRNHKKKLKPLSPEDGWGIQVAASPLTATKHWYWRLQQYTHFSPIHVDPTSPCEWAVTIVTIVCYLAAKENEQAWQPVAVLACACECFNIGSDRSFTLITTIHWSNHSCVKVGQRSFSVPAEFTPVQSATVKL